MLANAIGQEEKSCKYEIGGGQIITFSDVYLENKKKILKSIQ